MIRHLLKMVWNRKRVNGLIMAEIFVSFLVLAIVLTAATYCVNNLRKPLGYSIDRVWKIQVNTRLPFEGGFETLRAEGLQRVFLALRDCPEIESTGWMYAPPYATSTSIHAGKFHGLTVDIEINRATDDVARVLQIPLVAGRWFSAEDNASALTPVVINESYARLIFGNANPLGLIPLDTTCRVVGVMRDFRKGGELSPAVNYQIARFRMEDTSESHYGSIIIRMRQGITAEFQGTLVKKLEAAQKGWSFDISPLELSRESILKRQVAPLAAGGVVALFLLVMVMLGLTGVLWQNVSQRTREIGLRRALGATSQGISRQIHGEQFVITTLGVIAASVVFLQFPLLNLIDFIPTGVYFSALGIALVMIYAITWLCSLLPGWLAMDIEPAEALHYE
jgi:putative ABC transport system permease protein